MIQTHCIFIANNIVDVFSSPMSTPRAPPPSQLTPHPYSQLQQMSHHLSLPMAPQTPASSAYTRPIQFLPPNQSSSRSRTSNSHMFSPSQPFTTGPSGLRPHHSGSSTPSTSQQLLQPVQLTPQAGIFQHSQPLNVIYETPVISTPSFLSWGTPQPYGGLFSAPTYHSPYPPPRDQQPQQ